MSHSADTLDGRSQLFTLTDGKIVVSRSDLQQVLSLLSLTTPLVSAPRPPERHWSAIKSYRLYNAKRLLRRAIASVGGSMPLVLDAIDSFNLARGNEIYLDALEHYLLASRDLNRDEILYLLRLFRDSADKEFHRTASFLMRALNNG
ncbi:MULTISPECIES: hypothetical protein [unclassified Microcoleus]|uniref:hypothetical protein n=1 Tax=unclassified Microcoleus TaxID=2642155 RepID=UPI002FD6E174